MRSRHRRALRSAFGADEALVVRQEDNESSKQRREIGNAEERCREAASEAVGEGLRILGRTFEEHWPEQWLQLMDKTHCSRRPQD